MLTKKHHIRLLLSLFITCIVVSATAQTQYDMNMEAAAVYQKADKELNEVYQEIIKRNADDTIFIKNLKASQRLWVQFRDAELDMIYPDPENRHYGSVYPMCVSFHLAELTQERITELKQWIDGVEEGDVCNGNIPLKQK